MKTQKNKTENLINIFRKNNGHPFKIILEFHKGQLGTVLKTLFFLTLMHSPVWIIPIVTSNVINIATYPNLHTSREIWINISVLAIFILQNVFTTYALCCVYNKFMREIELSLRSSLIQKLQCLSISFHKNTSAGKLLSKIIRDCENLETLLTNLTRWAFYIITDVTIAIVVTARKSPTVLLFFAVFIPIEIVSMRGLINMMRKRNSEFRVKIEETQSNVSEMLELIPVTRAHGLQNREIVKMDYIFDSVKNAGFKLDKINDIFGAGNWVIMQASQLVCLTFTGLMAYHGKISIGEVVLYQTYFGQIVNQVNSFMNLYPQLSKGFESINSISEVLCEDDVEVNNSIIPLKELEGKVEFRDVDYMYSDGTDLVLKNFNLLVKPGESIAFVGGSGAGKSTIINLLIGFDRPQGGKILIDGINMSNIDLTEFRQQIAVVPQNTILFAGTIRDNIAYGVDDVTDEQIEKVIKDVGLDDIIDALPNGINTYLGEHGGKMSGGQRQRIAIARALLRNPKIIIFDEATSALDSVSEKKVQESVDKMMHHCTTFMVAHRLSTIKNADRIAVLDHGSIIEIGSYDELMAKKGAFYNLKKLQE